MGSQPRDELLSSKNDRATEALQVLGEARSKLTLVVGAGASLSSGLPPWDRLMFRLLMATMPDDSERAEQTDTRQENTVVLTQALVREHGPTAVAEWIRANTDKTELVERLREALYDGSVAPGVIPRVVARLALTPKCTTYTTNFDDLIEEATRTKEWEELGQVGELTSRLTNGSFRRQAGLKHVCHLHGLIPWDAEPGWAALNGDACDRVVLSDSDFYRVERSRESGIRRFHRDLRQGNVCLLVGCSLRDPHLLRRLMETNYGDPHGPVEDGALGNRYAIFPRSDLDFARRTIDEPALGGVLRAMLGPAYGVARLGSAWKTVRDGVEGLREDATEFFEQRFKTVGLTVLWADDYRAIPQFIHEVERRRLGKTRSYGDRVRQWRTGLLKTYGMEGGGPDRLALPNDDTYGTAQRRMRVALKTTLTEIEELPEVEHHVHPTTNVGEHLALHLWVFRPRSREPGDKEHLEVWASTASEYEAPWVMRTQPMASESASFAVSVFHSARATRRQAPAREPLTLQFVRDQRFQSYFAMPITGLWGEDDYGLVSVGVIAITSDVKPSKSILGDKLWERVADKVIPKMLKVARRLCAGEQLDLSGQEGEQSDEVAVADGAGGSLEPVGSETPSSTHS